MSTDNPSDENITAVRTELFRAIREVRSGTMKLEVARQVNELAKTLVATAQVEVDFIAATDGDKSAFLGTDVVPLPPGIKGVTTHRLK